MIHSFQQILVQNPDFDVFSADAIKAFYNLNRDLAMKTLVKYKLQRDESLKQKNELALKLKKYEDKHFNRDTRRGKR